ncbi:MULTISPECIES: carboxypeptidase M32 [Haloarcula]|uniref:Metal-dependent carboxypeptidase n=1 Tax=Haloarcula pellucida TaxID=1427151 RepID=A0A830GR59_9EURY|nr:MULTISPECIES: carboxypeptidase M32 [Halomicroarcula]MBX0350173.1 carboxypeptidase M32 [Halomicroarcula pellucida]MDS0277726.1 carboxypeptidase M32 [Halomicroarcula sp. S1AR25-4]GGO00748.1 carboxypeptidase M32 [Halomicroarcula pellucida]
MATASETESTYEQFLDHVKRLHYVSDAGGVLQWDQQVMMPSGGTPARAKQSSALSTLHHDLLTDDQLGEWLDELEDADLDPEQEAVVREVRRDHERAVKVPADLVERISEASSNALPVWEEAKAEDDFEMYADTLEEMVELRREYAEAIDPDRDPYEVLFEEYEPYLGIDTAEDVLTQLRDELVPLVDDVADSDVTLADPFEGTYDEDDQHALVEEALDTLGYDWDHGRLDTAPHPFSTGTQFDARVTTRFKPDDPMDAIGSTIHEFGHATYTLGLPQEAYGTPLGDNRDLSVHESQSRFWENHIGRSQPFWDLFTDTANEHLGIDATPREFYEAANEVYEDNLIRVEADELTYHMHIVLRFEIERDLIRGDLAVEDVPEVWNDKMEEYLGVRPDTDAEGCLQDIHWTNGALGYFPTYTLGSVLAAQLDHHLREDVGDVDSLVREGDFDPIHDWLTENVHRHGARYETDDLVQEATGESFTADYFLDYADAKYRDLYDC